ncbi:sensor domain-containing diguanylate cyclase [Litorilituus sediminis]|uniref:diguanylate cyclase n=1 Tax=Litorilituus sediminis TaxID=718192 RepID=A0A4P6P533_9GAMM|nr:sensor domain-containing diguanylate cyclase [Litorilituus sediminis]QBG36583.1 GGDEF domain-containing protein [Litorilituus sediminis]
MDNSAQQLAKLLENSRANEAIAQKLFEIETEILACNSSNELLQQLLNAIKNKFSLTNIALLLIEPTPINHLIKASVQSNWHQQHCYSVKADELSTCHPKGKPLLSNQLTQLNNIIPEHLLDNAQSIALIPLTMEGKLFASLLLTDANKQRFHDNLGTFHLEQLAVKTSLCLANVLIREQLEYMANYDRLTGVANRRLMEVSIQEELNRQKRYNTPFALLFIDCNKFKQINDTYGHDCGDQVLTYVATQIQTLIRDNDKCFRYAGDEFVVTLSGQNYQQALQVAKRLTEYFQQHPMPYNNTALPVTISCGAAASDGKKTMAELLKQADEQLYLHKKVPQT